MSTYRFSKTSIEDAKKIWSLLIKVAENKKMVTTTDLADLRSNIVTSAMHHPIGMIRQFCSLNNLPNITILFVTVFGGEACGFKTNQKEKIEIEIEIKIEANKVYGHNWQDTPNPFEFDEKKKQQFLKLTAVQRLTYDEIEAELNISKAFFPSWWIELRKERKKIYQIKNIWRSTCPDIPFDDFYSWYEKTSEKCFCCGISQEQLNKLWRKYPNLAKQKRGKKIEIDRLSTNKPYSDLSNLVFSCSWCSNLITDTFTDEEFTKIGKVIGAIWEERLKE